MKHGVIIVIRREDKVLAIVRGPRGPYTGYWSLPSGHIDPGEGQADAVAREAAEELGLEVTPVEKVWECLADEAPYVLHWWTVRVRSSLDDLRPDAKEVSEARWVTASEFLALEPTFAGDREFFARVLPTLPR